MPIEGSLREFALHDIFQLLHLSRKTGELVIVREPSGLRGSVVLSGGAVVGADVDGAPTHLGYLLLNAGKITEAELNRAEQIHSEHPERTWSEIFTSLKLVSPEDMEKYIRFQVEEFVYEMLDWQEGRFSFGERAVAESESVTWIPTESLLMEGARREDELSALPTAIESARAIPRLSQRADEGGVLDLSPEEWEVVGRIDGESDVRSIAWMLGRSEFEVSRVVSKLTEEGLLEIGSREEGRTKPPHEIALDEVEDSIARGETSSARQRIDSILRDRPEEPRAHFLAARIFETSGDLAAAAKGYETTLDLDPLAEEARLRLGLVRLRLGDVDGATREWTAYLRMAVDTPERRLVERAMTVVRELEVVLREFDDGQRT